MIEILAVFAISLALLITPKGSTVSNDSVDDTSMMSPTPDESISSSDSSQQVVAQTPTEVDAHVETVTVQTPVMNTYLGYQESTSKTQGNPKKNKIPKGKIKTKIKTDDKVKSKKKIKSKKDKNKGKIKQKLKKGKNKKKAKKPKVSE